VHHISVASCCRPLPSSMSLCKFNFANQTEIAVLYNTSCCKYRLNFALYNICTYVNSSLGIGKLLHQFHIKETVSQDYRSFPETAVCQQLKFDNLSFEKTEILSNYKRNLFTYIFTPAISRFLHILFYFVLIIISFTVCLHYSSGCQQTTIWNIVVHYRYIVVR
jgi:hypothetical protein